MSLDADPTGAVPASAVISADDIASALGQHRPTDEQRRVIEAPLGPLLVVAGAGSGKTETMSARVVWLVANAMVSPERILGLTFTRKAAGELALRVRRRLNALRQAGLLPLDLDLVAGAGGGGGAGSGAAGAADEIGDPVVSTYHSYAASVLADHGLRLGVEPGSRLLGEAAAFQLAHEVVEGWDDLGDLDAAPSTVVSAVLALAGECSEHLVAPHEVAAFLRREVDLVAGLPGRQYAKVRDVLAVLEQRARLVPVVERYVERKRELEVLDFGDQVALAARLASEAPEVARTERARFGVVLLDEYQDTSHAQLVLLRRLFGDGHPVTAVGDPHQSIYGWRGASAGGLERFRYEFPLAADPLAADPLAAGSGAGTSVVPAPVLALSTSWRNDTAVLAVANHLADPLRSRSALEVPVLGERPGAGAGRVLAAVFEGAEEEAEQIAGAIAERWWHDQRLPLADRRTAAVLCRKRSQFDVVEQALRARGLPVEVVGVGGLLSRPEVVDVVAALQVVHDPGRGDALLRLLTGPRWRIGPRDLAVLSAWSRRTSGAVRLPGAEDPAGGGAVADGNATGVTTAPATGPTTGPVTGPTAGPVVDPEVEDPAIRDAVVRGTSAEVVDAASLVAALESLPPVRDADDPDAGPQLSPAARERLTEVAAVLRRLRGAVGVALPDLVVEAQRVLLLDVELAARPGVSPSDAGAHLEALVEVAAGFAEGVDRPTLGGFLAWVDAAQRRERGLAPGEEGGEAAGTAEPTPTAVQVLTVHAAKGLEWDVVAVPGLVERTFPAGGETSAAWLAGLGTLPHALRGDRDGLPELAWRGAEDGKEADEARQRFLEDSGAHALAEERRLAYVAVTRARSTLLLSGAWWGTTGKKPRTPSRFLVEAAEVPGVEVTPWPEAPAAEENPHLLRARTVTWPFDPLAGRRAAVEEAAALVHRAAGDTAGGQRPSDVPDPWAEEVERLLEERDRGGAARSGAGPLVVLPAHLSASRLVDLAHDPAAMALAVRRPVPAEPRPAARRGTRFHAWLEERFRAETLVDLDDLPGAVDDSTPDDELADLKATFLASEWAERTPLRVEVDLETPVGGLVVRCRVDAVFGAPERGEGGVDVVDWKTGRAPTGDRARAAAVQLAVYRLAWSRWRGVPLDRVGAAFFYAATGETTRPADLLDEAALEALVVAVPLREGPAVAD